MFFYLKVSHNKIEMSEVREVVQQEKKRPERPLGKRHKNTSAERPGETKEVSLRDKILSEVEQIIGVDDPQKREQKIENYVEERVSQLTQSSQTRELSLIAGTPYRGFIHPESLVRRSYIVDPVRINDNSLYIQLLDSIRQYRQSPGWQEKSLREIAPRAVVRALGDYFGNAISSQDTNTQNKAFYLDRVSLYSEDVDLEELKGKSIAVCTEKAGAAQNLLTFLGYDSELVMSSKCRLNSPDTDDPDGHAYIVINSEKGHSIFDPTNPVVATKEDGTLHDILPSSYPITTEQYQTLMNGGQVEVTHYDQKWDGKTYSKKEGVKRIYGV